MKQHHNFAIAMIASWAAGLILFYILHTRGWYNTIVLILIATGWTLASIYGGKMEYQIQKGLNNKGNKKNDENTIINT